MARNKNTAPPEPPPTVLEMVEKVALQAAYEVKANEDYLESLRFDKMRIEEGIVTATEHLASSKILASGLAALYCRDDVR